MYVLREEREGMPVIRAWRGKLPVAFFPVQVLNRASFGQKGTFSACLPHLGEE